MKSKGAVRLFAILFALVCLFQLSFTLFTYLEESEARSFAESKGKTPEAIKKIEKQYLDSIATQPIYPVFNFTYRECKEREINLGLDLKGGMNVTLEVSIPDLIRNLSNNNQSESFTKAMAKAMEEMKKSQEDFVTLFDRAFRSVAPNDKLAAIFSNKDNRDLVKANASNDEVITYIKKEANQAIDRSFEILRSRIDQFGTAQPNIQKLGNSGRILVELPGIDDPVRVRKILQATAKLEFYKVYDNKDFLISQWPKINASIRGANVVDSTLAKDTSANAVAARQYLDSIPLAKYWQPNVYSDNGQPVEGGVVGFVAGKDTIRINELIARANLPRDMRILYSAKRSDRFNADIYEVYAIQTTADGRPVLDGGVVTDARKDVSEQGGKQVSMTMNTQGALAWKNITGENKGKSIAIVLDDKVYSAPVVRSEIAGGRSEISGNFTEQEAADLANILKAGKMPAPAHIVEEAVVGPTMGQESINSGFFSFVIALLLILAFMVFYYSNAGWAANLAMFCNIFFIMGVLASLNAVLTMPGIAGIVLTIGLSVDANILIFERIREELSHGKALSSAVRDGFKHALSSILDSNITTLLLGIILYAFGSGPVQGFATTLVIGILTSLFSAIFISRLIFERWLSKNKDIKFGSSSTLGTFKNININFVGRRKSYYIFSGLFILTGVVFFFINGFNYGVGFSGGRSYTVRFEKEIENQKVRESLTGVFKTAPEVKTYGENSQKKITTAYLIDDLAVTTDSVVATALKAGLDKSGMKYEVLSSQKVGPTVADDIKFSAIQSILFACALMFIFIVIRFNRWQFALGATVALIHDVLIILSFFTILNGVLPFSLEIDQDFIAAILTVMGYSMTDTVVVFDRIREFLANRKKKELEGSERIQVINMALNNTLSRTLITSLTIFMVLLAIFIFGGEVIRGFSFALLIGIVIGTYSSICIATPIVIDFDRKKE